MENLLRDDLFIKKLNISDFDNPALRRSVSSEQHIIDQIIFETNSTANLLNDLFMLLASKKLDFNDALISITNFKETFIKKEENINQLFENLKTQQYHIYDKRWVILAEWINLLTKMQLKITANNFIDITSTIEIYQAIQEIIKVCEQHLRKTELGDIKLETQALVTYLTHIKSDFSKIKEDITLESRTKKDLIIALKQITDIDPKIIEVLEDNKISTSFIKNIALNNDKNQCIETIIVSHAFTTRYVGNLTIKLKVRYPKIKLILNASGTINLFTSDYSNNWYAQSQDGHFYFGLKGQKGSEILKLEDDSFTSIAIDNDNNWYGSTSSGLVYFGKKGSEGNQVANLEKHIVNIRVDYNNKWFAFTNNEEVHCGKSQGNVEKSVWINNLLNSASAQQNAYIYYADKNKLYLKNYNAVQKEIAIFSAEIIYFNYVQNGSWYLITADKELYFSKFNDDPILITKFNSHPTALFISQDGKWYVGTSNGEIFLGYKATLEGKIGQLNSAQPINLLAVDNNQNWYVQVNKDLYFGQLSQIFIL